MISAFDHAFYGYAERLFESLHVFNPGLDRYAGDLGLLPQDRAGLERMGVRVVSHARTDLLRQHRLSLCFGDFLVWSFLANIQFDQVLWIDADTLILRPLEPALQACPRPQGLVGHPGRHRLGPIWTMEARFQAAPGSTHRDFIDRHIGWTDGPYLATGLWLTNDRAFLRSLDDLIDVMYGLTVDSPVFSAVAHHRHLPIVQLDPDLWNFSRDLVCQARLVNGEIVYGSDLRPYTVSFSRTDDDTRLGSHGIEHFYRNVIEPRGRTCPLGA